MSENKLEKDTAYDVFISYSSKDKTVTDALCHYLEEQKIRCWIAPRDIRPGQKYAQAIDQAIKGVKIFILVCSDDSLRSQWVQMETNLAVSDKKIIIPFKIKNCSLEDTGMKLYLNDRHWIDAVLKPEEKFGDLAAAVIAFLGASPSDLGERTSDFPEKPGPVTQYEFDGASFSKEQILKIAKFQVLLSVFVPVQILMLVMLPLCLYLSTVAPRSSWEPAVFIVAVICLLVSMFSPLILWGVSSFLRKRHFAVTITFVLSMTIMLAFYGWSLHHELSRCDRPAKGAVAAPVFQKDISASDLDERYHFKGATLGFSEHGEKFGLIGYSGETIFKNPADRPSGEASPAKKPAAAPPEPASVEAPPAEAYSPMGGLLVLLILIGSPVILLYEIEKLKKILCAVGLKTSFWGVPRSEIRRFAEGSDSQTER